MAVAVKINVQSVFFKASLSDNMYLGYRRRRWWWW